MLLFHALLFLLLGTSALGIPVPLCSFLHNAFKCVRSPFKAPKNALPKGPKDVAGLWRSDTVSEYGSLISSY